MTCRLCCVDKLRLHSTARWEKIVKWPLMIFFKAISGASELTNAFRGRSTPNAVLRTHSFVAAQNLKSLFTRVFNGVLEAKAAALNKTILQEARVAAIDL